MQVPRPLQVVVVVLWEELLPDPRKEVDLPTGHRAADQEEKRGREGGWERVSGRLRLKRRAWGGREARGEMWETEERMQAYTCGKKNAHFSHALPPKPAGQAHSPVAKLQLPIPLQTLLRLCTGAQPEPSDVAFADHDKPRGHCILSHAAPKYPGKQVHKEFGPQLPRELHRLGH